GAAWKMGLRSGARPGCLSSQAAPDAEVKNESAADPAFDRIRPRSAGAVAAALCRPRGEINQGALRTTNRRLARGPRHGPGACGRAQRVSRSPARARIRE